MRLTLVVTLVTLVLQLFLAFTPLIPQTAPLWHTDNPSLFYSRLAVMVGVQFTVMTLAVGLLIEKELLVATRAIARLISSFPLTAVKAFTDVEFYSHFLRAVEDAKHTVRIAYFAPYPPHDVSFKQRNKYYEAIVDRMKRESGINFKRLVRATKKNIPWVLELANELEGRANVSLALLTKDLPAEQPMPLALSVQVVDDSQAWLVATASHETDEEFRDVYIENPLVSKALADYYDRLWEISVKVLDHGRFTDEGRALLKGDGATTE